MIDNAEAGQPGGSVTRTVKLPKGTNHVGVAYRDEAGNWGPVATTVTGRRCLPRKLGVSSKRIGPARLGRRLKALRARYRVKRRGRRATVFCVRRGGRFLVAARKGRVDLVATTARRHGTRKLEPGKKLRRARVRGARRIGPGVFVGRRPGKGRVVYGLSKRGRVRFLAVVTRKQTAKPLVLRRRLRALGLRGRR